MTKSVLQKKYCRNLWDYFYLLYCAYFYRKILPIENVFDAMKNFSANLYTLCYIYIQSLRNFVGPTFALSAFLFSLDRMNLNDQNTREFEGIRYQDGHIGTCSLHIPFISLYLFLLLFFLQRIYIYI